MIGTSRELGVGVTYTFSMILNLQLGLKLVLPIILKRPIPNSEERLETFSLKIKALMSLAFKCRKQCEQIG